MSGPRVSAIDPATRPLLTLDFLICTRGRQRQGCQQQQQQHCRVKLISSRGYWRYSIERDSRGTEHPNKRKLTTLLPKTPVSRPTWTNCQWANLCCGASLALESPAVVPSSAARSAKSQLAFPPAPAERTQHSPWKGCQQCL